MIRVQPGRLYVRVVEGDTIHTYADAPPIGTDPSLICGAFTGYRLPGRPPFLVAEVEGNDYRAMVVERVERMVGLLTGIELNID